ncbi:hypothetical protein [Micromonospora sp. 4G55]|uniref:hypothetical protein n=1 Tax=Micromonospora sp. 4G55 TaxID=2806102 RepID=UPI001A4A5F29|nr:hypothetical protein [Micromonospora sp. 4G55]MBM0256587.1 hypothetical protein [Micromonospora sp. 4G55]
MPEQDVLATEFARYRQAAMTEIEVPGPAAVRRAVRRRRRNHLAAGATAALTLLAGPVVGYAALNRPTPDPTPVEPTPSATASPSPMPSGSGSPTPSSATTSTSPTRAPDGRISRAQLLAARLPLPAWPSPTPATCTTENVRLHAGPSMDFVPALLDVGHGDLDRDGATETVALLGCRIGEAQAKQLVAFDRDDAGRIVTLGRIVGTEQEIEDVTGFVVQADGQVRAQVADLQPCCDTPAYWTRHQWRTYGWDGDRFTRTGGPAEFGPDTRLTDLSLSAAEMVLGPAGSDGRRPGTLTLTVTNRGPIDAPQVGFSELELIGTPDGGDWAACRRPEDPSSRCRLAGVPAGERRTYTFRFLVDPDQLDRPSALVVHLDSENRYWKDRTLQDNHVNVRVKS